METAVKIRPAVAGDLPSMALIDRGPDAWDEGRIEAFVCSIGVVKVVEGQESDAGGFRENAVRAWYGYKKYGRLLAVERFVAPDELTALAMVRHLNRYKNECSSVDLTLSDRDLDIVKTLAWAGFTVGTVRNYFGPGDDAVTLHKGLG